MYLICWIAVTYRRHHTGVFCLYTCSYFNRAVWDPYWFSVWVSQELQVMFHDSIIFRVLNAVYHCSSGLSSSSRSGTSICHMLVILSSSPQRTSNGMSWFARDLSIYFNSHKLVWAYFRKSKIRHWEWNGMSFAAVFILCGSLLHAFGWAEKGLCSVGKQSFF